MVGRAENCVKLYLTCYLELLQLEVLHFFRVVSSFA
jgi:hypothetical protein